MALALLLGQRIDHVVGAENQRHVGLGEFAVDVVHLEHLVVGHLGFGEQDVHVPRHAPGHRVDRVLDRHALGGELRGQLLHRVLRARHRQAVAGNDDHGLGVGEQECGVVGAAAADGLLLRVAADRGGLAPEAAEDHADERPVHRLAHDVGQDRARGADQRAGDDQHRIVERKADARRRPARVAVQHRDHHRHVGAADRNDEQETEQEGERRSSR